MRAARRYALLACAQDACAIPPPSLRPPVALAGAAEAACACRIEPMEDRFHLHGVMKLWAITVDRCNGRNGGWVHAWDPV